MSCSRPLARFKRFTGGITILSAFIFFFFILIEAEAQNIGIGTPSPVMKLHVSNGDSAVLLLENTQLLNPNISTGLYFRAGNGYTGAVKTIGQNGFEARLGLFTYASEGTSGLIERLSILDNGNVGIGTTNPGVKLHVNGAVRVAGKISNVANPTDAQDVATKAYVDLLEARILELENSSQYVEDIEHNRYKVVTIGTQVWMSENLRVTRFNDGTPIPLVTNPSAWANLTTPAYTWYNNTASVYGALYNFYTVADTNTRNICPAGWHVPSKAEWTTLSNYLGGAYIAGGKMKESGLAHWYVPNVDASNESGFTALPGGQRNYDGSFAVNGYYGIYWTSTEHPSGGAWCSSLPYDFGYLNETAYSKPDGFSVRCVKD